MLHLFGSLASALFFAQTQAVSPPPLTADQWRQDLAYLATEWPKHHPNLFHFVSEKDWRAAVQTLDQRIPQLQRHEIIVELGRLSGMIRDSHTGIGTFRQPAIDFHRLPIDARYFTDGVFIVRTSPEQRNLLGAKIVKVGTTSVSAALDSVSRFISQDPGNSMRVREIGPIMMTMPEVMNELRFIPTLTEVPLTVEKNGRTFVVSVPPVTRSAFDGITWVDWQPVQPIARSQPGRKFWFQYLAAERIMYVQINEMDNDSTEYLAATFEKAVAATDTLPVDRFVIDLRYNGGGSSSAVRPMVISLVKSPRIDQYGKLFVLIGRFTASAAQNFANDLERLTSSVFIGEPTAQNPNFYSDGYQLTLPNSKILAYNATIWSQSGRDTRPYIAPNVVAEMSSADYQSGRDPALEAARTYSALKPLPLRVVAIAQKLGTRTAGDSLAAIGAAGVGRYRDLSRDMIRYSFDELWTNGHSPDAILLLESNALAYPSDWNSHDALAGAYENLGRFSEALVEYQRALAINPSHQGVKDGIARVKERLKLN